MPFNISHNTITPNSSYSQQSFKIYSDIRSLISEKFKGQVLPEPITHKCRALTKQNKKQQRADNYYYFNSLNTIYGSLW